MHYRHPESWKLVIQTKGRKTTKIALDVANLERNLIDSTYELSTRNVDDIITEHLNFQSNLGLEVKEEFRHLAKHYWTPKMHKK